VLALLDQRQEQEEQELLKLRCAIMLQNSLPSGMDMDLLAVIGARTGDSRFS
jgi:hypothetical protein